MESDREASPDRYMTASEAATYLGYAIGTLYNKCTAGEVPHLKFGRSLRFRRSDLDAWVREQNPAPAETVA